MRVVAIVATCGRHTCIERSLRLFMNQSYPNKELIIFNNSNVPQVLSDKYSLTNVKMVNSPICLSTLKPYKNLGEIYRDALTFVPSNTDIIVFWDDDDIFLPEHISEGVNGYIEALSHNKIAYKPKKSYSKYLDNPLELVENTLEPSIFVKYSHILQHGFSNTTTEQHLQWVNPLRDNDLIYVKSDGKPTMIYNWGDDFPTFKTSGDFKNPNNFNNYRNFSQDHGDRVITPIDNFDYNKYF